jgi:hypothetical protein
MQAVKDQNRIPVILGVSNTDGETPISPYVNPTTHEIMVDANTGGSDLSGDDAYRDENRVTTMIGVSSDDGETPVPVYVDSVTRKLLISLL